MGAVSSRGDVAGDEVERSPSEVIAELVAASRRFSALGSEEALALLAALYEADSIRGRAKFRSMAVDLASNRDDAHRWWLIAEERLEAAQRAEAAAASAHQELCDWREIAESRRVHIEDLETLLTAILSSKSWKLTAPFRRAPRA